MKLAIPNIKRMDKFNNLIKRFVSIVLREICDIALGYNKLPFIKFKQCAVFNSILINAKNKLKKLVKFQYMLNLIL